METCDLPITKPSEALFHLRIFIHATTFTCVQRQKNPTYWRLSIHVFDKLYK